MWRINDQEFGRGTRRWEILDDAGGNVTFGSVCKAWQSDEAVRAIWIASLRGITFEAYCWECPPVTAASVSRPFECVFISSPALARMRPEPEAFAEHFREDASVVTFRNLGGDATLVAPCPAASGGDFAHLASFVASAIPGQASALWQAVGTAMQRRIGASPVWLSTAGLGVAWLHVRLDSRPKYYRHAAYIRP